MHSHLAVAASSCYRDITTTTIQTPSVFRSWYISLRHRCIAHDTPKTPCSNPLVEEADDLASNVLAAGLLVVHDASRGGQDDVAELTGWEELDNPLLEVGELDVVAWVDDAGLVEAAVQLDDDLAGAVVIDLLELADVA